MQATRASRPDPITHQQAVRLIGSFHRFPVQDVTSTILMAALDTRQRFQITYWDSAIIEASRAMGCTECCPKTWATARTMPESGLSIHSAKSARPVWL